MPRAKKGQPDLLAGARIRHLPTSNPIGAAKPLERAVVLSVLTSPHFFEMEESVWPHSHSF